MSKDEATALIIGGGIAGLEAAMKLGQGGYRAVLVEKEAVLGGNMTNLYSSFPRWEDPQKLIRSKIEALGTLPSVTVLLNTELTGMEKLEEGYMAAWTDKSSGKTGALSVQAVIVATGFTLFDASIYGEYGYGIYPNVMTSLDFEQMLKQYAQKELPAPGSVAFFECVGSRDRSKGCPYCSKICCMYTAKQAGVMKDLSPETKCCVFYMDYRAAGKEYEEFTRSIIEDKGVRYVRGRPAKVLPQSGRLEVRFEDTLMGIPMTMEADVIVLACAIIPRQGTKALADMLVLKTDEYGFIEPVYGSATRANERIFIAGACGFAVESFGALAQGAAAAAEVMVLFNKSETQ